MLDMRMMNYIITLMQVNDKEWRFQLESIYQFKIQIQTNLFMQDSPDQHNDLFATFTNQPTLPSTSIPSKLHQSTSNQLLQKIYTTLNSPQNHKIKNHHKSSISLEDTHQSVVFKCNCKKSKCLKLYCECFARGSFCNGCNCQSCHNTQQFIEIRAKAIDEVMVRAALPFGHKNSSIKGCNCKKTGCQKKYCECFGSGEKCSEYCKCSNCLNC